jgi:ABC-type lipoprotein release transport system permease subunit
MSRIDSAWAGIILGLLAGVSVALWVTGVAASVLEVIFRLHSIRPPFELDTYHTAVAAALVCLSTLGGFVLGWLSGIVWNARANLRPTARFR